MEFSIINLDQFCGKGLVNQRNKHGDLLPDHVRAIICGPSNSGKTNLMLNLLCNINGLKFWNVYVFSKSLYQDKYMLLEQILRDIPKVGYYTFTDNEEIPHPSDIKPNSVMIFDDISCEKQSNIRNYFTMGRHNSVDTFHLCQSYSKVAKQLIRDNANFIILFKQDQMNLKHVYYDHVDPDMTFNEFKSLCTSVWHSGKNSFVVIDKEKDLHKGRYRCGMNVNQTHIIDI